ncbi:hypothetical protein CI41S_66990 [Bradyrhizobium ivorense]|nr:hypothetical protein CI41S_66990 [Bradyrhizobium ivorense]
MLSLPLAVAATNRYLSEVQKYRETPPPMISEERVSEILKAKPQPLFDALGQAVGDDWHIDKIGFARAIVEICTNSTSNPALSASIDKFVDRVRSLFRGLNTMRRKAERDASHERVSVAVDRLRKIFLADNPNQATREQARFFLEQVEDSLDDSIEADAIRTSLRSLNRDFKLDEELTAVVPDYEQFGIRLAALKNAFELNRGSPG